MKHKNQILWLVEACQVRYTLGIFNTLKQAHHAVCEVCEPDSHVKETKQYMSLHRYEDNSTQSDYYLIWDETDGNWYRDEPIFSISQFKLGNIGLIIPN